MSSHLALALVAGRSTSMASCINATCIGGRAMTAVQNATDAGSGELYAQWERYVAATVFLVLCLAGLCLYGLVLITLLVYRMPLHGCQCCVLVLRHVTRS